MHTTNKPSRLATNVIGLWSCVFRWMLAVWQPGCWKTWHHWRSTLLVCLPSMTKDKPRLWQTASPQVRNYHRDCYIHKYFWNAFNQSCWCLFRNRPGPSGPEEQWHLHEQLQGVLGSPGVWCGALSTHLDTHRRRREQWGVHGFLIRLYVILSLEDERKSPGNLMIHLSGWKTLIFFK